MDIKTRRAIAKKLREDVATMEFYIREFAAGDNSALGHVAVAGGNAGWLEQDPAAWGKAVDVDMTGAIGLNRTLT